MNEKNGIKNISEDEMREIAAELAIIAKDHGLKIESCAEAIDLEGVGITDITIPRETAPRPVDHIAADGSGAVPEGQAHLCRVFQRLLRLCSQRPQAENRSGFLLAGGGRPSPCG